MEVCIMPVRKTGQLYERETDLRRFTPVISLSENEYESLRSICELLSPYYKDRVIRDVIKNPVVMEKGSLFLPKGNRVLYYYDGISQSAPFWIKHYDGILHGFLMEFSELHNVAEYLVARRQGEIDEELEKNVELLERIMDLLTPYYLLSGIV